VLLSACGRVPAERSARLIGVLAAEGVLAADETPVNVLHRNLVRAPAPAQDEADPEEKDGTRRPGRRTC
jgi:hypothetical protein